MRLWEKVRRLTVSDHIRLPYNSKVTGEAIRGVEAEKNSRDVLNAVGGVQTLTAAKTLTAADSGTTFFLGLAGGFTVTLPAPSEGLRFKFIVSVAPTTAYVITTNGGADIMIGGVDELAASTVGPYDNNADTINFVAAVAARGDFIDMICDGTTWFYFGQTNADGGVTTSTT